jgi:hypothetical protein
MIYNDALSAVFNFVVLHTGKFKDTVYHNSLAPASISKKIYLGGSADQFKNITEEQKLSALQNDFDFIYDAVKYHQFIYGIITASKITVTKLPATEVKP